MLQEIRKVENVTHIKGVGLCFNKSIGTTCFRTGCSVLLCCHIDEVIHNLRKNIIKYGHDSTSTLRLKVKNSAFWFSDQDTETLFDDIIVVSKEENVAKKLRHCDIYAKTSFAQICVLEEEGSYTIATWLFRHDVIDGWRCLRYLTSLLFSRCDLTLERLRLKHDKKPKFVQTVVKNVSTIALTGIFIPRICCNLASLSSNTTVPCNKMYFHAITSVDILKRLSKEKHLGSLSNTLTSLITAAYFEADRLAHRVTIASNVLFDANSTVGNHVCIKAAVIKLPKRKEYSQDRLDMILHKTSDVLASRSQCLTDMFTSVASRAYVMGKTPNILNTKLEKWQKKIDILVSNLPAFDHTEPKVQNVHISRDYEDWKPNIVYVIGIEGFIYLDFYWTVSSSFDTKVFKDTFTSLTHAENVNDNLPKCY